MRAEPDDRVILAEEPEISPVSVPRIFAVGLVLPFAHPVRLILGAVLPGLLIAAATVFGPIGRIFTMWQDLGLDQPTGLAAGAPPVMPQDLGIDFLEIDGILLLSLALWLCTWQRAVARGFGEPILRWLGSSLRRLPGYVLAFLIWTLAPAVVVSLPLAALGALVGRNLSAAPMSPRDQMIAIGEMFSSVQLWALGIGLLTIALVALWLNARLSPLPALVASQGWRRAFGRAWQLSRGHGFGLAVSLFAYTVLAFLALVIAGVIFGVMMFSHPDSLPDPGTMAVFGGAADLGVTMLIASWHASLGALMVRDGLSPAETIDPALFG